MEWPYWFIAVCFIAAAISGVIIGKLVVRRELGMSLKKWLNKHNG